MHDLNYLKKEHKTVGKLSKTNEKNYRYQVIRKLFWCDMLLFKIVLDQLSLSMYLELLEMKLF